MIYKFTGNTAMKKCVQLNEELELLTNKEQNDCKYSYLDGEEPLIPDYDPIKVSKKINVIIRNIGIIKTALRSFNMNNKGPITGLSLDELLVILPMMNNRKRQLDSLRSQNPKLRITRNNVSEYIVTNYDMETIEKLYQEYSDKIVNMQEDINYLNATGSFEVELSEY